MRVDEVGGPGFLARCPAERASEGDSGEHSCGAPAGLGHGPAVGEGLLPGPAITDAPDRDLVETVRTDVPAVARGHDPNFMAPFHECAGKRVEKSAGDVAGEARVVVGQKDDAQPLAPARLSGPPSRTRPRS